MQSYPSFISILEPYKHLIDQEIKENVDQLGPKSSLRDACEYALLNGGKRFRPALVLIIAKSLGYQVDVSQAALGIEYFHTASLIADDLPCMDNDDQRRSKPTVHKIYGESIALLATYALISAGYACLVKNGQVIRESVPIFANQSDRFCVLALENATYNTGLWGVTGGQFLDISPPDLSLSTIKEILHKKTGTLFEISFVQGWIFGGGNLNKLEVVKKSAAHFGLAFQIVDDLEDSEQDSKHAHSLNIANILGKKEAIQLFYEEMRLFDQTLIELQIDQGELNFLSKQLIAQVEIQKTC